MTSFVKGIANSQVAEKISGKVAGLTSRIRTGPATRFTAGFSAGTTKLMQDLTNADSITQIMTIIILLLFFIIFFWSFNKISLNEKNCKTIEDVYDSFPMISSMDTNNPVFQYKLRDYYIKTAYNCCASGNLKNDFVNICALRNCIKQGARCLDFEIYSVNNSPVVAVSSTDDFHVKESYNDIELVKVLEAISIYAFSGKSSPNPDDPLILHFRIMTNSKNVHDEIARQLYDTLQDRILGKKFSYENYGLNIGSYPISKLMGKIIIMVDKTNPLFTNTLLNEYVNITSNSAFVRLLRYKEVAYNHDKEELLYYNKENMTITLPNLSGNNKNYSSALVMTYGCQMIGMSFQNFDNNLKYYTKYFDDAGSAFVLRSERYRYVPVFIPKPPCQDPDVTFADKLIVVNPGLPPVTG